MNKSARAAVLANLEIELDRVRNQTFEEDIATIERLCGTRYIHSNASVDDVKRVALAQVKSHALECINGTA
jgi:hypothetical protein